MRLGYRPREERLEFAERRSVDKKQRPLEAQPGNGSRDIPLAERYSKQTVLSNYSVSCFPWVCTSTVPKRVPEPCGSIDTRCSLSSVPVLISQPSP